MFDNYFIESKLGVQDYGYVNVIVKENNIDLKFKTCKGRLQYKNKIICDDTNTKIINSLTKSKSKTICINKNNYV